MKRLACGLAIAAFAFAARAGTEEAEGAAPPRSVEDILAVLDQYKPDPKKIEERRHAADATPPSTSDKAVLAHFYLERAGARGRVGRVKEQIEDMRLAAQYSAGTMTGRTGGGRRGGGGLTSSLSPDTELQALRQLAYSEMSGGNFVNAVRVWEQTVKTMEGQARPRQGGLARTYADLAAAYAEMGELGRARELLGRAEDFYARMESRGGVGAVRVIGPLDWARGRVQMAEGKYPAAEKTFRKAINEFNFARDNDARFTGNGEVEGPGFYRAMREDAQASLAWATLQQGRLAEAEGHARKALNKNLAFYGRYAPMPAASLNTLALIVAEQGRFREAALLAAASVDSLEKSGSAPESLALARARRAQGAALVAQRKWTEAIAIFERMHEGLARDPQVARRFDVGDINWGLALVKTGQAARAVPMLQGLAEAQQKRLGDKDVSVAELRGYLGIALAATGERDRALREFQRAVPLLLETARSDQAGETGATARWMRTTNVLEGYIGLLVELWRSRAAPPGFDAAAEAFRIADAARGSSVQRALAESASRGAIRDPALAQLAREQQEAQHRAAVLSELIPRLLAAPREQQLPQVIEDARRELTELREQQGKRQREIEKRFPDYAALVAPKPLSIAEAQSVLRPGEAVIALYVGADQTYVWAVPQKGAAAFSVAAIGHDAMAKRVAHLREALDLADASLANFPKFDLAASYALYSELLKPVEPAFREATSLLVVAHGALGHLPFGVLTTEPHQLKPDDAATFATYKDAPWLIKRAAVTQLPSVATLATLRRTVAAAKPGRREFIGIGDPLFTKTQMASAPAAPATATRGVKLRNLAIAKVQTKTVLEADEEAEEQVPTASAAVTNSSQLAQLAPLPDTAEEILRIAEVLKASSEEDVYLRLRASETLLKKLDLSHRRVVAFATHGLVPGDLNGLTQPALALSAPDVVGGTDDGLLTMEEILGLKLDADWVVLSACNTASGEGAGAEAVSGLGRAFFFAGARALLVSNWPVETTSARALTTGIFRHQAEQPTLSRAQALRETMLDLMNGPGPENGAWGFTYAHPMFWAPFSLVGEGAAL